MMLECSLRMNTNINNHVHKCKDVVLLGTVGRDCNVWNPSVRTYVTILPPLQACVDTEWRSLICVLIVASELRAFECTVFNLHGYGVRHMIELFVIYCNYRVFFKSKQLFKVNNLFICT